MRHTEHSIAVAYDFIRICCAQIIQYEFAPAHFIHAFDLQWNWSDYTGMSRRARVNAAFCLSRSNCHTISWMHVVAFVRFGLPNISTFWADDHYWRAKWALIVTASAINSNNNEDGGQTTINLRVSKRHWQAVGMPIWEVTKKNICVDSH